MLRLWNLNLVVGTFVLTILGTFLTRSGVVNSVHAFSESSIGAWLLAFLALSAGSGLGLIAWRGDRLRAPGHIDSALSREAAFLGNNLLFTATLEERFRALTLQGITVLQTKLDGELEARDHRLPLGNVVGRGADRSGDRRNRRGILAFGAAYFSVVEGDPDGGGSRIATTRAVGASIRPRLRSRRFSAAHC